MTPLLFTSMALLGCCFSCEISQRFSVSFSTARGGVVLQKRQNGSIILSAENLDLSKIQSFMHGVGQDVTEGACLACIPPGILFFFFCLLGSFKCPTVLQM